MRRLRTPGTESLVSETELSASDLILPLFFDETAAKPKANASMPGVVTYPVSMAAAAAREAGDAGLGAVIVFGIPARKDGAGTQASSRDGIAQKAISGLKESSDLLVISDLCLCGYTDHGHCGVMKGNAVDNDLTLERYAETAVSQAEAGADMIAPSGMMDGQVAAIRSALDRAGYQHIPIMAYSAKYRSSFYGPFRDTVHTSLSRGDRSGYQMQCGNRREAVREMELDISEGADIIMVKPAMPYLDVVSEARRRFSVPVAAYQVSGEYSMIKAAAANGWLNEDDAVRESLLCIKRAGADMIITYFAKEAARAMRCRREP